MAITKKRLLSMIRHDKAKLMCAFRTLILAFASYIFYIFVSPYFSPRIATKSHVKDVIAITTKDTIEATTNSLKNNEFKNTKIILISNNSKTSGKHFFNTNMQKVNGEDYDLLSISNSSFVLFGSSKVFKVPKRLPALPKKNQVIGFTFGQCRPNNYALYIPDSLEACLLTKEALIRFIDFNKETLKGEYEDDEAFRIFTDLHSLRVLMLPCGDSSKPLPPWDAIEVIENENKEPFKPWGKMEKIPEVWRVTELV